MIRFDPNLRWMFTEIPMEQRYAAAAKAGFKGVEVAFPYDRPAKEISQVLSDQDLTLVQILSPCDWEAGERGMAAIPGREADFRESIKIAVDYSAQVGRPLIHTMPGNLTPDASWPQWHDTFLENIAYAADLAAQENITIILEPCCTVRFPDFFYHRLEQGIEVIESIGRSNVKVCFDTFHIQSEEGSITDRLRSAFQHVGHIQVGDVPGRREPGTGEIRFPFLFEEIERLGWAGWIGCEFTPSTQRTEDCLGWWHPYQTRSQGAAALA